MFYLYLNLYKFYEFRNIGVNYGEYYYIDEYIKIFINNMQVVREHHQHPHLGFLRVKMGYEEGVKIGLVEWKKRYIKEWEMQSGDLTKENFYEKCYSNLTDLNNYVKEEIAKNKN